MLNNEYMVDLPARDDETLLEPHRLRTVAKEPRAVWLACQSCADHVAVRIGVNSDEDMALLRKKGQREAFARSAAVLVHELVYAMADGLGD